MPRIVVLGTGTGVGKTFFTAALARHLAFADPGAKIIALKPLETGVSPGRGGGPSSQSDASQLERAAPLTRGCRPHPLYVFKEPISPHLAATLENRRVSATAIRAWVERAEHALHDDALHAWSIVETAGGALSPITTRSTNFDLARRLEPARWVLVAPDSLGVLHDVRATLEALGMRGRKPDYLVLSTARAADASTGTNARELPRLGLPKPIAVLGRDDPDRALAPLVRALLHEIT